MADASAASLRWIGRVLRSWAICFRCGLVELALRSSWSIRRLGLWRPREVFDLVDGRMHTSEPVSGLGTSVRNLRLQVRENSLHPWIFEDAAEIGKLPELEFGHGLAPDSTGEVGASS